LRAQGLPSGYLLLKALPFTAEMGRFLKKYPRSIVVEQNRDGQLASLLRSEYPELAPRIRSVLHYNGLPIDARSVIDGISKQAGTSAEPAAAR